MGNPAAFSSRICAEYTMQKITIIACFLLVILFIAPGNASPGAFHPEISPGRVGQGDVFLVRITNVKSGRQPSAVMDGQELHLAGCGEGCYVALGAADIQMRPGPHYVKVRVGTQKKSLRLIVKKVRFPVLNVTLPEDQVILSPENFKRAEKERKRLQEIFRTVSARMWEGSFRKPLESEYSTPFGVRRNMNGKWVSIHRGVDMKGKTGEEIKASNRGKVVLNEDLFFGGRTIILDHGQGVFTIYMHLSEALVKPEDMVSKGAVIGLVGSSGRATGPHLHFGVKVMDLSVNPVSLIKLKL